LLLLNLTRMIATQGYLLWLLRGIGPAYLSALILIVALSISVDSGSEMARRPFWYVIVLTLGSAVATAATWGIDQIAPSNNPMSLPFKLMDIWLTIMLFGGVFGWAAVLSVKRNEEQAILTQMLMRRSLLARQVAQARLFAARAQVDPEMVARVLKQVRHQYATDASAAGVMLDQLIAFLRLAMNRKGSTRALLSNEIDMMRGYATLRQVEANTPIDLQILLDADVQQQQIAAAPFFLLVRHVLRELSPASATPLLLQLRIATGSLQLNIVYGVTPLDPDVLQRLRAGITEILADTAEVDILHELSDRGEHRYVVKAAIG
ncbi:MAG: histidine kinase, partial [Burkholderiaceae bacterium]